MREEIKKQGFLPLVEVTEFFIQKREYRPLDL